MAITGIVMMAYADGFHGDSFMGVALAVGSASTSALYKVSAAENNNSQNILDDHLDSFSINMLFLQNHSGAV